MWSWKHIRAYRTIRQKKIEAKSKVLRGIANLPGIQKSREQYFHALIAEFFSEYFHVGYAWTHEEMIKEIEHHKIKKELRERINSYLTKLGAAKYQTSSVSQDDLYSLSRELSEIIVALP